MRVCNKCHVSKPLIEYHKDKTRKDGYKYICKKCANKESYAHHKKRRYNNKQNGLCPCGEKVVCGKQCEKCKQMYKNHRQKYKPRRREIYKIRIKQDLNYHLAQNLRSRLRSAIKDNAKKGSAIRDLGCSIEFLKNYIEQKFQSGMTWDNYGKWHIDHIIPLSSFDLTNRDDLLKACHYTNLQPLWAHDNISKGNKVYTDTSLPGI